MIVIRTAEELARALDSPLEPELKHLLTAHRDRLSEYQDDDVTELAMFAITEPNDEVGAFSKIIGVERGEGGLGFQFSRIPEYVEQHAHWIELVFILSDDGFGVVLFIPSMHTIDPAIRSLAMSYID